MQERQKKAKEEMENINMEKRLLTDKLEEKITKKLKTVKEKSSALLVMMCLKVMFIFCKRDVFGWNMICQRTFALQLQSLFM